MTEEKQVTDFDISATVGAHTGRDTEKTLHEWLLERVKYMEESADYIERKEREDRLRADWYRRRAKEIRDAVDILRAAPRKET